MMPNFELVEACQKGEVRKARRALDNGADANVITDFGHTPLMLAVLAGSMELVDLLLEAGAEVNAFSENHTRPLGMVRHDAPEMVDRLLEAGADIQHVSLINLAWAGEVDHIRRALDAGVPADPPGDSKRSALLVACERGQTDVVELLLERGADINYWNQHQTPLGNAARGGDAELLRSLLEQGAKPDWRKVSALRNAAGAAKLDNVDILIDAGAELDAASERGWTAVVEAHHTLRDPDGTAIIRRLAAAGADVNHADDQGKTALHYAAAHGDAVNAQALLECGADVTLKDKDGQTPTDVAVTAIIVDTSRRRMERMPTKAANDDYYEASVALIEHEEQLGLLTPERLEWLIAEAERCRCPELAQQLRDRRSD